MRKLWKVRLARKSVLKNFKLKRVSGAFLEKIVFLRLSNAVEDKQKIIFSEKADFLKMP